MIGKSLGHYRLEETLGKGGMGVVYRALDSRLQRRVALKVLPEEFTANPERRRRFLQEARAAGAVNHPAIAQIYDVDEDRRCRRSSPWNWSQGRTVTDLVTS